MRRIRYAVAASLDGYIAGPNGEADWIIMDPDIDFGGIFDQFDTFLIGRRTFEGFAGAASAPMPGTRSFVISRTLRPEDVPGATVLGDGWEARVRALREESGKDIWLFGGGSLFRSLLEASLVDTVEVAIIPVLLGGGTPLLPSPARRARLKLSGHRVYEKTGIVSLEYAVLYSSAAGRAPAKRARRRA